MFAELEQTADADGEAGDVKWNFEKFLVAPDGKVVGSLPPTGHARGPRARWTRSRRSSPRRANP